MRCPYLKNSSKERLCSKSLSAMSPDRETLERFCTDGEYDTCPILLASMLRSGQRRWVEKYGEVFVS